MKTIPTGAPRPAKLSANRAAILELPGLEHPREADSMDLPRADRRKQKRRKTFVLAVAASLVVALSAALWTLDPAVPVIQADTVWLGSVERGTFVRDVQGAGTLVPMQRRWITSVTPGRVEEILVLAGAEVAPDTVLLRLSNPDVEIQLLDARQQLADAEAGLVALSASQESDRLAQQALVAEVRTQYLDAKHQDEMNQELLKKGPGLVAEIDLARSRQRLAQLEERLGIEKRRLAVGDESATKQEAAQTKQVGRLRSIVRFNEDRVDSLDVRAGVAGVLAESSAEEGRWVAAGESIARVVKPGRLKAEVRILQNQASAIAIGQEVMVDTRGDVIHGQVSRIDPAVRNGTVTIDVALPERLPKRARPNMSVFGTVVIERLEDVTYMERPVHARADAVIGVYRLSNDREIAERRGVELGRIGVSEVEVRRGLEPGDVVVLSDMSEWDEHPRVRIAR